VSDHILLINPNSSAATSAMMLSIAREAAAGSTAVAVATAVRAPSMIVTEAELAAAAEDVIEIGTAHRSDCKGIVVSAFGDPGLEELRRRVDIPVTGLCEASMLEASTGGRRFGIATTTPLLIDAMVRRAEGLGLSDQLTGIRCTDSDPFSLTGNHDRLILALSKTVCACIELDGAQAVIIGGGPLGQAADQLQAAFVTPIIAPIPCAIRRAIALGRATGKPRIVPV